MPRRDETFIIYYWEDYEEFQTDNPSCLYCLSESTVQIILGALRFAGWPTRWRMDRNDYNRSLNDPVIWDKIDALSALAQKEIVDDMACDFEAGFANLADAIRESSNSAAITQLATALGRLADNQCCDNLQITSGGFFGPTVEAPVGGPTQTYGDEPLLELPPGTFPENYETLEDYKADKCRIANAIVDGWISSINNLSTLGVINFAGLLLVVTLVITGVIIFPPSALPLLFYFLGGAGFSAGLLAALSSGIQDNREEIVCLLYTSDSTDSIMELYADILDLIIAAIPGIGSASPFLKGIAMLLSNGETLNQLFSGTAAIGYAGADCSSCDVCPEEVAALFTADLDGWQLIAQSCNSGEDFPSHASAVVAWTASNGGSMRMTANPNSPVTVVTAESPPINEVVQPGNQIVFQYQNGPNPVFLRVRINTDLHCDVLNGATSVAGNATDEVTFPLTIWEGETIETIQVYCANSVGGSITFDVGKVVFNCAP